MGRGASRPEGSGDGREWEAILERGSIVCVYRAETRAFAKTEEDRPYNAFQGTQRRESKSDNG
jgi:hypothetical protein